MKVTTNEPKVRVGTESNDLDFLLDQVANGDLTLAYVFTKAGSDAGNMLRAAIDMIQVARKLIREHASDSIDFEEVENANR